MPELPEVETMCRGIAPVVGSEILDVHFVQSRYKRILVSPRRDRFAQKVVGQTICCVQRRGKRILLELGPTKARQASSSGNGTIVIEPRMTGLMLVANPPNELHLRVGFQLRHKLFPWLWFWDRRGLGTVRWLSSAEIEQQLGPSQIGPDALAITPAELQQRLAASRRPVKVALLDQRILAGVGNLYASELLHMARTRPDRGCSELSIEEWKRIHESMQHVLQEAIAHEGSTLSDGTYRNALNQQGTYQNCHRVYGRAGEPCPRCRALICRVVQAQRSTFYCEKCQK